MKTAEFWNLYINKNILDIYEETCEFFSQDLPEEFTEKYGVGEVVLETAGHQLTAKNIENVLNFTLLLQKHQPDLYKENFSYLDDFLIDYYCFLQEPEKVEKAFANFIDDPLQNIDNYLRSFNKLLLYQHTDLLEQAVSKNFMDIDASPKVMGNATFELSMFKLYQTLEYYYNKGEKSFDHAEFAGTLDPYLISMNEESLEAVAKALYSVLEVDELREEFEKDQNMCLSMMHIYFQVHMFQRGFPFYLSGALWYNMMLTWHEVMEDKSSDLHGYFNLKSSDFERHLANKLNQVFFDNLSEVCALLWGSVYIYEFLLEYHIISKGQFDSFMETSRHLKGKIIGNFTHKIWNSNFVHSWEKPACISATEFAEEEKIFRKSIHLKNQSFPEIKDEISEELSNIGKLSDYIIGGAG